MAPRDPKNTNPTPERGVVSVTFDAGGRGILVDQNPVQPVLDKKSGWASVTWQLRIQNNNPRFTVRFGDVVLCDTTDRARVAKNSKIEVEHDGKARRWWKWSFQPATAEGPFAVPYDLFCVYEPGDGSRGTLSLRETLGVDPTMLLPPEPPEPSEY